MVIEECAVRMAPAMARRLNCHLPQVDRLLDLALNSHLDQVEAALRAVGKRIEIAIVDAA